MEKYAKGATVEESIKSYLASRDLKAKEKYGSEIKKFF